MTRNLDRRVEAITPIEEPALRRKLERLLDLYMQDNRGAWDMHADGSFTQRMPGDDQHECNSQLQLTSLWSRGLHPGQ
jgi:polyphosphate kinase